MRVSPPVALDGAQIKMYAELGATQQKTGATRHSIPDFENMVTRLAIGQYDGSSDFYLFYCTDVWEVVTDTCHESMQDAITQAEFEFTNISFSATHPGSSPL